MRKDNVVRTTHLRRCAYCKGNPLAGWEIDLYEDELFKTTLARKCSCKYRFWMSEAEYEEYFDLLSRLPLNIYFRYEV